MSKAETIYSKVQALPETAQTALLHVVDLLSVNTAPQDPDAPANTVLDQQFHELANQWRRETTFLSFMEQKAVHAAYQRIIGLGWVVVPLLLTELQRQPDHWLWALRAITGERPADGLENLRAATDAWLRWGRERGLLT